MCGPSSGGRIFYQRLVLLTKPPPKPKSVRGKLCIVDSLAVWRKVGWGFGEYEGVVRIPFVIFLKRRRKKEKKNLESQQNKKKVAKRGKGKSAKTAEVYSSLYLE